MITKELKVSDLIPYENNPRQNDQAVDTCAASIAEFGFKGAILVDKNLVIICGHTRRKALIKLGIETVPVQIADDLTDEQVKALRLVDNKVGELADWDAELLAMELGGIEDIDMAVFGFEMPEPEDAPDPDAVPDAPKVAISQPGDLWLLGRHRLLCGDSTKREDVDKLMDGKKADMVFTDPPYGINVVNCNHVGGGGLTKFGKVGSDNYVKAKEYSKIIGDETTETAKKIYTLITEMHIEKIIMFGGNYFTDFLPPSRCWIIWDKEMTGNFSQAEMAWTNYETGGVRIYKYLWNGLSREGSRKEEGKTRVHPTQKPVGLCCNIFENLDDVKSILDLFGGSGSTMIACEKTKRVCYMMELDQLYCDVIVNRMQTFTGTKAVNLTRPGVEIVEEKE